MAYRFKAGHRIRLGDRQRRFSDVTEALWSHMYRPDKIGTDTIHHSAQYSVASHPAGSPAASLIPARRDSPHHRRRRNEVRALLAHLGQARHDAASALRAAVARARAVRRARLRLQLLRRASLPSRRELDVVAEPLCGRRRRAHQAHAHRAMGYHRAAAIIRCGSPRRSPSSTRCWAGAWKCGLVPGINADYFRPFGIDYNFRKTPTFEFVDYLRAAYGETQPFSFHGENFNTDNAMISVQPVQKPHPPLWMMSRDPRDARVLRAEGHQSRLFPGLSAAPTPRRATANSSSTGTRPAGTRKPNIAYCTIVYVDETDEKALDVGARRARPAPTRGSCRRRSRARPSRSGVREHAKKFIGRGEPGASEIMANLFDPDYLMKNELVFIGSPETVAEKIRAAAEAGLFNVFLGEFNFADLPDDDLMRSIRLFGEKVMPALRGYEPF